MDQPNLPSPFVTKQAKVHSGITWKPFIGVIYALSVFFLSQVVAALITIAILAAYGKATDTKPALDNSVAASFLIILFAETVVVGAVVAFVKGYKARLAAIGMRKPKANDVVYWLIGFPIYFVILAVVYAIVTVLYPDINNGGKQELGFDNVVGPAAMTMTFISLVILAPLAEEVLVRGLLYSSLKKAFKFVPALILTSAVFGIAHLQNTDSGLLWAAVLDTFTLSVVLVYIREKSDSIWAGVLIHATKNFIAFTALYILHR